MFPEYQLQLVLTQWENSCSKLLTKTLQHTYACSSSALLLTMNRYLPTGNNYLFKVESFTYETTWAYPVYGISTPLMKY